MDSKIFLNWSLLISLSLVSRTICSQDTTAFKNLDTLLKRELGIITIQATYLQKELERLNPIQGTYIYSGKKNEIINLANKSFAISEKYPRQIFSKVPGIFVYDMDGTGNQMNVSTRGLDPHRSWEFNIRKDGIITNSDMYGYPASHYNIPLEAVERIELVRGSASLQYGAQFGGMLNYISKQADTSKNFSYEGIHSMGSYHLLSTFNRVSGTIGKLRYSAWMNSKSNEGYRKNGDSKFNAEAISISYYPTNNLHFIAEWTHSNYIIHLPGQLNDSMFYADPRQSTRARNYYNPDIHVPSFKVNWDINQNSKISFTSSAILGFRNSVIFDKPITIRDTISTSTLQYANRQVDIDEFNSFTAELRCLHSYKVFNSVWNLATGVQFIKNNLHRQQLGKGTTGLDFDLSLVESGFGRDMNLKSQNIAIFIENKFNLTSQFSMNAGLRYEKGHSDMIGKIIYYQDSLLPNTITHDFPLLGFNVEYNVSKLIQIYGGWSQAYRPVIFKDIIPGSTFESVDKNLRDAKGDNADLGIRGSYGIFKWDVSFFRLSYKNKLGLILKEDQHGLLNIYRTNIGNAITNGLEMYIEMTPVYENEFYLSFFTAAAFMDAKYKDATIRVANENLSINGNKVESVPEWIIRSGVHLKYKKFGVSLLHSYTAESFADPANTLLPDRNGAVGLVPAYHLMDVNLDFRISKQLKFVFNINNFFDKQHFTKRPQFYPGPGIWPSDGRTLSGSIIINL
ncbi:MAG: TonB-dependent receptor [Saprospiraceae bacterium]|nr:TonB-dependent receptor [Saprospiraceae bacterium]